MQGTASGDVLGELQSRGGECDYDDLLDAVDADTDDAHLAVSLLERDGYIYRPTEQTVKLV